LSSRVQRRVEEGVVVLESCVDSFEEASVVWRGRKRRVDFCEEGKSALSVGKRAFELPQSLEVDKWVVVEL